MDFNSHFSAILARVEHGLQVYVPGADTRPKRLHQAMRYSLEAGGKRLRPVLALAAADLFARSGDAVPAAIALECVHTYSLIHDDLPCMDNDDLRRGRPTAHKAFDEATALLAGDALLTHAFSLLAEAYAEQPVLCSALVRELGKAAGSTRLIGGQMADLLAEKKQDATSDELEFIHLNKTSAMIEASLVMGGLCGGATPEQIEGLRHCGRHLGLTFQIIDDILDVTSDSATLGKTAGKDLKAEKTTYVKVHGLEAAQAMAHQETEAALNELALMPGDSQFIAELIRSMEKRIR
jgi:geranylgeranyl diphosphate synthase, type II